MDDQHAYAVTPDGPDHGRARSRDAGRCADARTDDRTRHPDRPRPLTPLLAPALAFALAIALPGAAAARQHGGQWFPAHGRFTPFLADPHEIRLAAGLAWTDLFDPHKVPAERPPLRFNDPGDMAHDLQGLVALGGTLPLWGSSADAGRGLVVSLQAGVFARFRLEEPSRDYTASDWVVALPVTWTDGPVAVRARVLHRSAHLGDEVILDTGARRIEYAHEAFDIAVAYRVRPSTRIYGGSTWIFRSLTEAEPLLRARYPDLDDDAALQLGFDGEWPLRADGRISALAGLDLQSAGRTGWRTQLSAVAGLGARGPGGGLRLLLRFFDGTSTLGEFFLTDESYWMIEAVVTR
ncbi:MAG TPA: DUF1207 domain-containing protein [Longimicrobiales bacterium]